MLTQAQPRQRIGEVVMPADANEVLFLEGSPCEYVYELRQGIARGVSFSINGDRQITAFFFAGDQIGLPVSDRYRFTVEAATKLSYVRYSRDFWNKSLIRSCRDEGRLLPSICAEQDPIFRRGIIIGHHGILVRICAFLVSILGSLPKQGDALQFPLSQLDIADYLATTPESICRGMRYLRQANIISQPERELLIVQNAATLEAIASGALECSLSA